MKIQYNHLDVKGNLIQVGDEIALLGRQGLVQRHYGTVLKINRKSVVIQTKYNENPQTFLLYENLTNLPCAVIIKKGNKND